ncbi:hypothetical protein [Methanosphaerula palustris]|uniref:Uncharacterized protein n=1 Tax=Methanosphaerula palustris (strain ATCC BAA-1556 / DSM 19958 / E1-9c) TaxID=521011 RepID=B8GJR8_METPE|nr:hypothetical protein [Methanosphaerula palustris]ACL15722.1 hypothetical protein Mpal_0340 [Methanosphaerula palustris E1-9c]
MKDKIWYMIAVLCLVCMLAGPVSALSITSDKHSLKSGENLTVNVSGMTNGTFFDLKVTNHQEIQSLANVFGNSNITIPFEISGAAFTISETNTTENSVTIGEYEIQPGEIKEEGQYHEMSYNGSSVNGLFSHNNTLNEIVEGTVITKWVATPMAGAKIVTSTAELNGTKVDGPENFDLNTSAYSANPATIDVEILANDTIAYKDTFFLEQGTLPAIIPTLIPGGSSASGSNDYTGATWTATPVANNTTANMTANVTPVISVTPPVSTTTGQPGEVVTSTGTKITETTTDLSGAATTANTSTTQPAGAPFALITLIGLGLACLMIHNRR